MSDPVACSACHRPIVAGDDHRDVGLIEDGATFCRDCAYEIVRDSESPIAA